MRLSEYIKENIPRQKLTDICQRNDISFLGIFGSFARGNYSKKSDVDILIRFKKGASKTLFDIMDIEGGLRGIFHRKVDLITVNSVSPYLKDEIIKSTVVIYEKR